MNRIKLIMIGLHESMELLDLGERTRMIAKTFSNSKDIENVIIIYSPVSLLLRFLQFIRKELAFANKYEIIEKHLLYSVYCDSKNIIRISLTSILPGRLPFSFLINDLFLKKVLKKIINKFPDINILWLSNALMINIVKNIKRDFLIFDAIDNLLAHPQFRNCYKQLVKAYEMIDKNADLIIIASEKQKIMFKNKKKLFLLPNAVDNIFFRKKNKIPDDLIIIKRPIVAYIGVLQERFNVEMMKKIISELNEINFVLIGPIFNSSHIEVLLTLENVYHLGAKKFEEIPAYLNNTDVLIIPHMINEFTDSMNPLKIYEYLSSGNPIVSTNIAGIEKFKDVIYIAYNESMFKEMIIKSVKKSSYDLRVKRISLALENNWDSRILSVINIINNKLYKYQGSPDKDIMKNNKFSALQEG